MPKYFTETTEIHWNAAILPYSLLDFQPTTKICVPLLIEANGNGQIRMVGTDLDATLTTEAEAQIETFKDVNGKRFVFYSRPGDDGSSRYSLEDLKINFCELLKSTS